jgi:hypothetical protein
MTDSNYQAVLTILNDIEAKGLYQCNKEYYDEKFFINFIEFEKSFTNSFEKIIQKIDAFELGKDEIVFFAVYSLMSYINSHLQIFEKFLKIIINPTMIKGGFDENTPLSQMIRKICNKMQYSEKLKNAIRGLFLVNFRDAIVHQNYLINKNGTIVTYPKDQAEGKITLNDLCEDALQVRSMFHAMLDWADNTEKPKVKKTVLDSAVNDLIHQVNVLDKKLDSLR